MNLFERLKKERPAPVRILHGTDWWTDCDDVAALRLLLNARKAGAVELLGIGINAVMEASAPSVSAFCGAHDADIPIGVDRQAVYNDRGCRYQRLLAEFPHTVLSNDDCPDAALMYRKILADLDGKADITEVGFPTILMRLLLSEPDEISPLTGIELVRQKVNRLWLMAGRWDVTEGKEYNLYAYPPCSQAGDCVCRLSPVPVTFLGYECGYDVFTGAKVPEDDQLRRAFLANGAENGNRSWDPMTVLAAIVNDPARAGYDTVRGYAAVDPKTGINRFRRDPAGPHEYLVRRYPAAWYAEQIDALL